MNFSVKRLREDNAVARLAVSGELDGSTGDLLAAAIRNALAANGIAGLVIDLAGVTFLDADGVRVIEDGHRLAVAATMPFVVINAHGETARSILDGSGVLTAVSKR